MTFVGAFSIVVADYGALVGPQHVSEERLLEGAEQEAFEIMVGEASVIEANCHVNGRTAREARLARSLLLSRHEPESSTVRRRTPASSCASAPVTHLTSTSTSKMEPRVTQHRRMDPCRPAQHRTMRSRAVGVHILRECGNPPTESRRRVELHVLRVRNSKWGSTAESATVTRSTGTLITPNHQSCDH